MYICKQKFYKVTAYKENQFMLKKWLFYSSLTALVVFISSGFIVFQNNQTPLFEFKKHQIQDNPSKQFSNFRVEIPFTGKSFTGFKEALGFKESQGKYKSINTLGYLGKYQFGTSTLATIGITDSLAFLNNPKLQEKAFKILLSKNKSALKPEIKKYVGRTIKGVTITESGILAAAHLGGAGSVKKYLKSHGHFDLKDSFGTSITTYLKKFAGYDTSFIKANKHAKIL